MEETPDRPYVTPGYEHKLAGLDSSEHLDQFAPAMALAQGEIKHAIKDSENPFHKSTYASLASVTDACRGPLTRNGFSVIQSPTIIADGSVRAECLDTIMLHGSGQWMRSRLVMRPASRVRDAGWVEAMMDPQALGSTITYLRRYALASMCGVAVEDDDGNAASGRADEKAGRGGTSTRGGRRTPRPAPSKPPEETKEPAGGDDSKPTPNRPMTDAQKKKLWATAHASAERTGVSSREIIESGLAKLDLIGAQEGEPVSLKEVFERAVRQQHMDKMLEALETYEPEVPA